MVLNRVTMDQIAAMDEQRIKKSLGSDFLDPSQLGYGFLKSSFEHKCSVCHETGQRKDDFMNCSKCSYAGN